MNAIATTSAVALIPRNMIEALDLAMCMAKAGFLAKELQTQGGALFVIEQSMRWNMSPFAVAMETSFIQGKPMFSGKIVAAAIVSSGAIAGRLHYDYDGEGDARRITVSGTLRGETEPRSVTVAVKDARTNNRVWLTQPDQQLAYHGARVWARRHAPEVMLGVYAPEEMQDADPPEPRHAPNLDAAPTLRAALPAEPLAQTVPRNLEVEEGKTLPSLTSALQLVPVPASAWLTHVGRVLNKLDSTEAVNVWRRDMGPHFTSIQEAGHEAMVTEALSLISDRLGDFMVVDGADTIQSGLPNA